MARRCRCRGKIDDADGYFSSLGPRERESVRELLERSHGIRLCRWAEVKGKSEMARRV